MPGTMARRTTNAYESRKVDDGLEALSNILSDDLRGAIRALGTFPLLSEEWCNMAKTLGRIAEVSEAEAKLSEECQGQGHEKDSKTLWEGKELALRHVLEEGKLNVCLRNLVELREFQRKRRDGKVDLVIERPSTRANLEAFEKGMGVVLRNAWTHIEALQTTDIPLLVRYITEVFREAAEDPVGIVYMSQRGGMQDRQEVVCLSYFRGLISSLSEYDEGRVMPHVRSAGTTASLASMLHVNHKYLGTDAATVGARALALVFDTEDYATYRDDYISNPDKDTFASLKEDFVADLCKDPLEKKILRPLLDVISYCQRTRIGK